MPQQQQNQQLHQQYQPPQFYNVVADNGKTNIVIERTRKTVILIIEVRQIDEREGASLNTVIDSGTTNHCFVDISMFTKYKRFSSPLAKKTIEKKMSFMIARQRTVKIKIEIQKRRIINLNLHNVLYTLGLHFNLISILKTCNLGLEVYFGTDNIVAKFDDNQVVIQGIQQDSLYYVKVVRKPLTLVIRLVRKVVILSDQYCCFGYMGVGSLIMYQVYPSREYISVLILLSQHLLYKVYLLQQPPFLQYTLAVVMQLSKYFVFQNRNTLI